MGVASALVFANLGSAYGTAKAGVGIASLGVIDQAKVIKGLIPIIMAGILGIYGLIVCVILQSRVQQTGLNNIPTGNWSYSAYNGYKHLASGLCCGLSSLAAGLAIGVAGDAGVRANAQKDIYVGVILILIFAEALGLYGLIISIILSGLSSNYVA